MWRGGALPVACAALGALLDGKELKAVLVQGVGESLRAAAR